MSWDYKYGDELIDTILGLESREEARKFFEDLCTRNEILLMQQRFAVAMMLNDNKTYQEISEETGASTATISRVSRSLNYGVGGYEAIIKRMKKSDT